MRSTLVRVGQVKYLSHPAGFWLEFPVNVETVFQ